MYEIDYLLKYISNDTFKKINKKPNYILEKLHTNYIDTNLNIRYLIKYGITNIDKVIYNMIEEIAINHNEFIKIIKNYEKTLTKDEIIILLENQ